MGENNEIPKAKIGSFYKENHSKAEDILNDEDKMERIFQQLEKKLKTVPIAGNALAYIPLMMSLVRSYVKKEYTEVPVASMISIVVALLYFLSPVDLIPDVIVGLGLLDDTAVILGCLAIVQTDLDDYRKWRKENGLEIDDLPEYEDIKNDTDNFRQFTKSFFNVDGNPSEESKDT